jgi:predicted Zn-dependent peptidase
MSRLGKSELAHGEILSLDEVIERIDAVTADDCRGIADEILNRPRALAVIGPFEEDAFQEWRASA